MPIGQSLVPIQAFERVTLATCVGSVVDAIDVHGVEAVPILHATGELMSKKTVSIGNVTLTPAPEGIGVAVLTENV